MTYSKLIYVAVKGKSLIPCIGLGQNCCEDSYASRQPCVAVIALERLLLGEPSRTLIVSVAKQTILAHDLSSLSPVTVPREMKGKAGQSLHVEVNGNIIPKK